MSLGLLCAVLAAIVQSSVSEGEQEADCGKAGGFTFDLDAVSKARFKKDSGSENLLPGLDEWKPGYCYMHNKYIDAADPRRKQVRSAVEWRKDGDGLTIVKKPELLAICGDALIAANVSGGFSRTVRLPDASGGTYRVSFKYKMRHEVGYGGYLLFTPVRTKDAPTGSAIDPHAGESPMIYTIKDVPDYDEDATSVKDFHIKPGFDSVKLVLRIDGVGELRASDISMARQRFDDPVTVLFSPAGYLDGTYAFSSGQCGIMGFQWQRNDDAEYNRDKMEYELSLPRGYALLEATMAKSVTASERDGLTVYRMKANKSGLMPSGSVQHSYQMISALVRADADAPRGKATFAVFYAGRRISNVAQVEVFTVPKIQVAAPKRYCNGFYVGGCCYCAFRTKAAREAFADLFTSAGAAWIVDREDPDVYALWRRKGVRYITPEWSRCSNGFVVGDGKGRPDDQKYVTTATGRSEYAYATCPVAVYEEKSYFREKFLPELAKRLEGVDGIWANWEPYMFEGRGCFCDSCCREFAAWVKVPYDEVRKDWPQNIKPGGKYHGKVVQKFRSWQHGRLVKTIDKHVIAGSGGEKSLGFIPGVAWGEMSSVWQSNNLAPEVQPIDYAGSLRWIDPWGPYPHWCASEPYVENPSDMLRYWCAAKDVRAQVDKDYPPGARPKLLAFPHGWQLIDWICQPEGISMALDCFFFNRWEASVVYSFPKGYDARWWQAFAEATAKAARYEDAVLDGARVDDKVSLTPTPDYPPPAKEADPRRSTAVSRGASYLQCAAYDHEGRRICAVFNFAHKATARFTLKAEGLPPGRYEVLRYDGKSLQSCGSSRAFTSEELSGEGVNLVVPPLRTLVFEFKAVNKD